MKITTIISFFISTILLSIHAVPHAQAQTYEIQLTSLPGDIGYTLPIHFGNQMFIVYFDTGSSELWIPEVGCIACGNKNKLNPTGLPINNRIIEIKYLNSRISVYTAKADFTLSGIPVINQVFGLATAVDQSLQEFPVDGVMGFGRKLHSKFGAPSVFSTLADSNNLRGQIFSVYLERTQDSTSDQSRLTIG